MPGIQVCMLVFVCVCVCEFEREREIEDQRTILVSSKGRFCLIHVASPSPARGF